MKTLRDTNNNNSNTTTSNSTESHFSSNVLSSATTRHNLLTTNGSVHHHSSIDTPSYPSLLTQNSFPSANNWRATNDQSSSASKVAAQNPNIGHSHPLASLFSGDPNQLSSILQAYLTKFGGNPLLPSDSINPLVYFQLMNANALFMQQLSALQNTNILPAYNSLTDLSTEPVDVGRKSQSLQADSTIFVPKTRPMTQDEIAEHARLVYQRALQRNQLQQHNDLMKHFYETLNIKQQVSSNTTHDSHQSTDQHDVPSVPNVSNIASIGTFDVLDTMITSASSSLSIQEASVNAAASSFSLLSVDDSKLISNTSSILDPGAPVFIPRQSRQKLDDENETSSSSSDSDFNDFHYLDQFLEEFYNSDHEQDNHLIIPKSPSSETSNIGDEISTMSTKYPINHHTLGQGDAIQRKTNETNNEIIEQSISTSDECQYSIHQLLNRYRNPRCHLVLPEWSRLSLILPNVCSMRGHTYKIKRYFAYRRRLSEDPNLVNIPVQG